MQKGAVEGLVLVIDWRDTCIELGSECSVSDPETDTRCAGIASHLSIMGPEEPGKCNWHGRRCSIGEAGEGGGTC